MKSTVKLLLPLLALCWASAQADTISYTDSGTFSSSTPSSEFSGPSETWAFGFEADSNPAVSDTGMGGFDFAFSDFTYSLDGSTVAITPTFIRFFSAGNGGGFEICFNGTNVPTCTDGLGTGFSTLQLYTGSPSAPTLSLGTFDLDTFGVFVNSTEFDLPDTTLQASSTVPEPSTFLTLAAGLVAMGWRLRSRRS